MDVSLKALNYFLATVEAGTVAGAARNLHVVPSAVLAGVNQVEAAFGLPLTIRHRARGVALTAAGHALKPRIQHLVDEYNTLLKEGADLRTQLTGTLRVGYYAPIAPAFMPAIVEGIFNGNTDLDITFVDCDNQAAQDGLLSGAFDVIVCFPEQTRPEVTYQTLLELPGYLLLSAAHALAERSSLSLAELGDEPFILLDQPNITEYYNDVFHEAGISPRVISTATHLEMVRSLVAAGLGVSLLHMQPLVDKAYNGAAVRAIPLDPEVPPLRIAIGWFADNPRRLVRAFVDACVSHFESAEAERLLVR